MSLQLKSMALCCTLLVSFDWWKLKTFRSPWPRNVSRLEHWVSSFGSQWARTCRHCDLRSNYVLKGPAQVIFCPTHNWVYLVSVVCVCVCLCVCTTLYVQKGVQLKCMLQHTVTWAGDDCPASCVIAQQYSANFVWLRIHSRKEKFETHFKTVVISISLLPL